MGELDFEECPSEGCLMSSVSVSIRWRVGWLVGCCAVLGWFLEDKMGIWDMEVESSVVGFAGEGAGDWGSLGVDTGELSGKEVCRLALVGGICGW